MFLWVDGKIKYIPESMILTDTVDIVSYVNDGGSVLLAKKVSVIKIAAVALTAAFVGYMLLK